MYVRNAWYVACTADEIAAGALLGRTVCGERLVLFRAEGGAASALEDFCPHSGAPLSLGALRDDGRIVCGYHGLVMGGDGKCVSMPGQRVKPTIKSFPVLERYGFVWVWPGNKGKADAARLHPLPWAESPEWAYRGGLFHVKCDYRLMVDNLMDLTHETYVHATSIGQPEIEEAAPVTSVEGDSAITRRSCTTSRRRRSGARRCAATMRSPRRRSRRSRCRPMPPHPRAGSRRDWDPWTA